jgi:glycolate oxidase FAD binding subunit
MPVPGELATACADVTSAGAADTVGGRQARYVAAPSSTGEASTLLRAAAALGLTVVPRGDGRLQHWGNPPDSCDLIVDTRRLDRVVEHRPDNFTVTVQAGVRLNELEEVLEAAGQHLAMLPPPRAFAGTVGGLIATNAAGSWRYRYGTPRDLLTGITVVRADGKIVRSGEAVSNVAGQDLVTLFAGSYGSLGLITEATFGLHPLPERSGGVWVPCADPEHAARLVEIVKDPWMAPSGIDLRWAAGKSIGLIVMVEGDRHSVQERRNRLNALAGRPASPPIDPARARRLDAPDHGGLPAAVAEQTLALRDRIHAELLDPPADTGTLVRVCFPAGQLAGVLTVIRAAAVGSGLAATIDGSAGAGVLDVEVPAESDEAAVARFVAALRSELSKLSQAGTPPGAPRAVVVYAPDEVRNLIDTHGPVPSLALIRAVKDEFDPEHRMAPGRLADAV